jgi:hypothetical protein
MMRYVERRYRAPRREGHRTTLTVPRSVLTAAERLATELGTTPNDAIVRLAEEGAAVRERQARIAAVAAERRAAVEDVGAVRGDDFPTPQELRDAMLAGRRAD